MSHHVMADMPADDGAQPQKDCCQQTQCDCDATLCHYSLFILPALASSFAVPSFNAVFLTSVSPLPAYSTLLFKPPKQ